MNRSASPSALAPNSGRLILLSAPSGAGKTTLVRELLAREPTLCFSVSYTTRPQRPREVDGQDYFFVSTERFAEMVHEGDFLEHARVFDHRYGTSRAHVDALLETGKTVLLEIDWQGARQVRAAAHDVRSVFILPPSVPELKRRLEHRASDSATVIARRFRDAVADISHWQEFDYAIVNDDLQLAAAELNEVVMGESPGSRTNNPRLLARVWAISHG